MCERLLPSFTSPFVSFVNIAFTDLLTELLPSTRYWEGYKDKSDKCTFQKIEGERSNTQADYRVGRVNAPDIKCCRGWLVLGRGVCRGT